MLKLIAWGIKSRGKFVTLCHSLVNRSTAMELKYMTELLKLFQIWLPTKFGLSRLLEGEPYKSGMSRRNNGMINSLPKTKEFKVMIYPNSMTIVL